MTGFQIFLCVILGIIGFFLLVLSIPIHVDFTYSDKIYLTVRYLFIKLNLLPAGEKKPKKEKPKKEKPAEEKPKEEKPKKKKTSILDMVKANGYDGMMALLSELMRILSGWGGKVFRSVVFDEIQLYITVGTGDSASTAIEYGNACQKVYPLMGFLCSNNVVRRYDCNVTPDFLANHGEGEAYVSLHLCVRKILNATIAMAVRLVFKVLLKFLKGAKAGAKPENTENTQPDKQSVK